MTMGLLLLCQNASASKMLTMNSNACCEYLTTNQSIEELHASGHNSEQLVMRARASEDELKLILVDAVDQEPIA